MQLLIGILIGLSGGTFVGIFIMALCIASSRSSRAEEQENEMIE